MGGQQSIYPIRAADRHSRSNKGLTEYRKQRYVNAVFPNLVSRRAQTDDSDHRVTEKGAKRRSNDAQSRDQGETCRDFHTGSGCHGNHGQIRLSDRLQNGIGHGKQTDEKGRRCQCGEQRCCKLCGIGAVEQGQNRLREGGKSHGARQSDPHGNLQCGKDGFPQLVIRPGGFVSRDTRNDRVGNRVHENRRQIEQRHGERGIVPVCGGRCLLCHAGGLEQPLDQRGVDHIRQTHNG